VATDGEQAADALVTTLPQRATFVGVGVGKRSDSAFLKRAADTTGGAHLLINPNEDLNWRVFDMLASLNTPRVAGLAWEFIWDDDTGVTVIDYANRLTIADGETLAITREPAAPLHRESASREPSTIVVGSKRSRSKRLATGLLLFHASGHGSTSRRCLLKVTRAIETKSSDCPKNSMS
jgi:hypothetical protein